MKNENLEWKKTILMSVFIIFMYFSCNINIEIGLKHKKELFDIYIFNVIFVITLIWCTYPLFNPFTSFKNDS